MAPLDLAATISLEVAMTRKVTVQVGLTLVVLLLAGAANALLADKIEVIVDPKGTSGPGRDEWLFIYDVNKLGSPGTTVWSVAGTFTGGGATIRATEQELGPGGRPEPPFMYYVSLKGPDPFTIGTEITISYPPGGNAQTWKITNEATKGLIWVESVAEQPEPGTMVLLATGLLAMALVMRRRIADGIRGAPATRR